MQRILVDVTDSQLRELSAIVEAERRPRAAVLRDAIEAYIALHKTSAGDEAFGLWKERQVDGLDYQEKLRSEW